MLGQRHPYADGPDVVERAGIPMWEARPCNQCGLPRANEVHTLPPAPVLDAREAAAGEGIQETGGPLRVRIAAWTADNGETIMLSYDQDQLAVNGPVVLVDVDNSVICVPLGTLETMVQSIRRSADES